MGHDALDASAYDMPAKALRLAMLTPNKTLTWAQVQAHRCHGWPHAMPIQEASPGSSIVAAMVMQ